MEITRAKKQFQQINLATILMLFVLILAGGVVRSTGSGMGCPDWPKCFDQFVPPTSVSQIPKDYKVKYVARRIKKNEKFAHTLDMFGYTDLALRLRNDKSILVPEEFNAAKTWTEYINRLIGALSGVLLMLTVVFSAAYWKEKKQILIACVLNVFLVGFQAWLGSIVVSTNLVDWIVTLHMLLALAILGLCIYTYHAAVITNNSVKVGARPFVVVMAMAALLISIVQISIGTGVRAKIDGISGRLQGLARESWVNDAGQVFLNHRDMAILVLFANVVLYGLVRKYFGRHSIQQQAMSFTFLMIMLQIVSGIALSYADLPPVAQAAHIVLSSLIFGAQVYLLLNLYRTVKVWGSI